MVADIEMVTLRMIKIHDMRTGNNKGFILKVFIRAFTSTHGTWK